MNEFLLPLLGAIIGFLGAILGGIILEKRRDKKELKEFYSWLASLLYILLEEKKVEKVKEDLTKQTLHYTFNRLWARIPQIDKKVRSKRAYI